MILNALNPIQAKYEGYIPRSLISDAMKLEKGAEEWLSKQGQYYY